MQAARFHAASDIRVESIPKPTPSSNEVLIEIDWCGICGTDLHEYIAGPIAIRPRSHPHPLTNTTYPVTLGHEFCGRVAETYPSSSLQVGQRVMIDPRINCKDACHSCNHGVDNLCSSWGFVGLHSPTGGGFSQYAAVDARMCYPLPDSVKMDEAALIEPLAVARHALAVSEIPREDWPAKSVLVLGGGPTGLAVLWNLRAVGVKTLVVSEPTEVRRRHTKDLASHVFNSRQVDVAEECRTLTEGLGVDIVFDCAGLQAALKVDMDALKVRGVYVNVAGWEKEFSIPFGPAMTKELTIKFTLAYDYKDFQDFVDDFVAGKFEGVAKMITSRIALRDIVAKGFDELIDNKNEHVKILVTPREDLLAAQS
ncbi:2,3-butanediol dehydrogenase like protein [Zymoseptoria brevis]|uniref:2,3-butanediol dehydrogenase like protein n=1 Tax=Zymoseptoria brevis TaxID=1047168 RepID=A0A0F4GAA4_9PEZI|nr:2,3-butanediol dehydrogenase like protein [Zymoseptoria brevis]